MRLFVFLIIEPGLKSIFVAKLIIEYSLKSLLTPKSPKGDFFKLLIFSSSPLGVRGKNGKNQQFEGFLYCTQNCF
ncbi:hypothetical protein [Anaerophaga thermohalophila]|uniref:hypothetical protein n=1 Tax=Anaerophaga thermohalophila TaxID=177400 RepID=UPI000237C6D1